MNFWLCLESGLAELYHDLVGESYAHGTYKHFVVRDPKQRDIYVAKVRDRIVHQLMAEYLEHKFGAGFYSHSYAAQRGKGVSAARTYALKIIRRLNNRHQVWIGKLDVRKYFYNIDHGILVQMLSRKIKDVKIMNLCRKIIKSFGISGKGLPLGNLTSQWFANIYLHELDFYAKHVLKIKYYLRYNDDMILASDNKWGLCADVGQIRQFVNERLLLNIPTEKVAIAALPKPVDILGLCSNGSFCWWRKSTVKKAQKNLGEKMVMHESNALDVASSYYGLGVAFNHLDIIY